MLLIKKTLAVACFIALHIAAASGQTPKADSLETLLEKHRQRSEERVDLLNELSYELFSRNPDRAKEYAGESLRLATELDYPEGKAAALWATGLTIIPKDRKAALELFREALQIAERVDDRRGMCNYLTAIGNTASAMGDMQTSNEAHERVLGIAQEIADRHLALKARFNIARNKYTGGDHLEAIRQFHETIKLAEELHNDQILANTYGYLGMIYRNQNNAPIALKYFLQALPLNEKAHLYTGIFANLINIAGIQSSQNDHEAALKTIDQALELASEKKDSMRISVCYTNMGNIYRQQNSPKALDCFLKVQAMDNYYDLGQKINNLTNIGTTYLTMSELDKAAACFDEALALARKAGLERSLGEVCQQIGSLHFKRKQYGQAEEYTRRALDVAQRTEYAELRENCYRSLAVTQAATGNFREAYANQLKYKTLSDSLMNERDIRKVALLESSYEFAKERQVYELEKAGQILKIRNQRQAIYLLAVIALFILLLSTAAYYLGRMRKRMLTIRINQANRELDANRKAMAVAKLKLVQNSERNAQTISKLEEIGKYSDGAGAMKLNALIGDYRSQAAVSNWDEFETLFTRVNTSFWERLQAQCPTLTSNERKLCVFLKLNMSNKDIALITFQSEEALKKSRLRLRRKFGLDRSDNLSAFIQQF